MNSLLNVGRFSPWILVFLFGAVGELYSEELWDEANFEERRLVHEHLFDTYINGKKCVFSKDKQFLQEVVIYDQPTTVEKSSRLKLPDGTRVVLKNFRQLVVRGKTLNGVSVTFGATKGKPSLKQINSTDEELLVFKLGNLISPKVTQGERDGSKELVLEFRTDGAIALIEEVSLRYDGDGIAKDFLSHQKKLMDLDLEKMGKRRADFLRMVVALSFDDLSSSLGGNSESFERLVLPATMGAGLEDYPLKGVLVDRRVAKLYEGLSRMEPGVAEQVATELFASSFDSYEKKWQFVDIMSDNELYGPQAYLFLCSEFCSPEKTIGLIDQWEQWHAANLKKGFQFEKSAGLDKIFSMNLHLNMIRKRNNWSIRDVNDFLASELGPSLKIGGNRPPTVEWNELRSSDWTDSQIEVLNQVPVFSFTSALSNPARHDFVFEFFRKELFRQFGP